MAPFNSTHKTRPDTHRHHALGPHFTHNDQSRVCDHCTYFKGIVYRSAARQHLTGDGELVTRYNNTASGPRSLESIAKEEEAVGRREHAKYIGWSRTLGAGLAAAAAREADKLMTSGDVYAEKSDTLMQWVAGNTKEELLGWLEKRGDEGDNMEELRQKGIFDLREYILNRRNAKKATKKMPPAAEYVSVPANANQLSSSSAKTKKPNTRCDATEQRVQAHKSLKPLQAALRAREEPKRWYDSKKAPGLKDELRQRSIRLVPRKKVDMIELLVEDDKKGFR